MSEDTTFQIVFQDNNFICVNKSPGLLTQSDVFGTHDNLIDKLELEIGHELFLVHRLDRPVSGVLVIAKNTYAANHYTQLLKKGKIQKKYIALVQGQPITPSGQLVNWLIHDPLKRKALISKQKSKKAKKAILDFQTIGKTDHYTGLEITLQTGRFHQIRAQLSAMKCPIKGDVKYGARRSNKDRSIHLHALSLEFDLPYDHSKISLTVKPPKDSLWDTIGKINPLILQDKVEIWKIKK